MKSIFYSLLWLFLLLLSPILLLVRAKKSRAYLSRWYERYALTVPKISKGSILIHAVSVGENIAAQPLINALLERYPNKTVIITCTTCTGSDWIRKQWNDELKHRMVHVYLPYDAPWLMARFLKAIQPSQVIVMETEVWPALIKHCYTRQIPLLLANARLSEKSFLGYQKAAKYLPMNWQYITHIIAQAPNDAQRFKALGAPNVSVSASLKFEPAPLPTLSPYFHQLKTQIASHPSNQKMFVWVAASTHQGEDEIVLEAHQRLLKVFPNALLLLVPRHPERFDKVFTLCQHYFPDACMRRSAQTALHSEHDTTQVLLIDSIGEMMQAFQLSQKAFIGGSFNNNNNEGEPKGTGGHNPIEPLMAGNQVSMGASRFNFAAICEHLDEHHLLALTNDANDLATWLIGSIPNNYQSTAATWLETQKGALAAHLSVIDRLQT